MRDVVPMELESEYFIDCVEDGGIIYRYVHHKGIKYLGDRNADQEVKF